MWTSLCERSRKPAWTERSSIGETSFHRAASQLVIPYHVGRNHQGLDNRIAQPEFPVFTTGGDVRCPQRLGGLLRYYYREAA